MRPFAPGVLALALLTLLPLAGCTSGSAVFTAPAAEDGFLIVDPVEASARVGTHVPFTATLVLREGGKRDVTEQVQWESLDEEVATVAGDGVAHALAEGDATLRATLGELDSEATLHVKKLEVRTLVVTPPESVTLVGVSRQLRAFALYDDGSFQDVTGDCAWRSVDEQIASVDDAGRATGVAKGNATLEARLGGKKGSGQLRVVQFDDPALSVQPGQASLPAGSGEAFGCLLTVASSRYVPATELCDWSSSNTSVGTVSNEGPRKGLLSTSSAGKLEVQASLSLRDTALEASSSVEVTDALLSELVVQPSQLRVPAGTQGTLRATAYYEDGSSRDVTREAGWVSSDRDTVHVVPLGAAAGDAIAREPGRATVSAYFGGLQATSEIEVTNATLERLVVVPGTATASVGTWQRYVAEGHFSDGTVVDLSRLATWRVSDAEVAHALQVRALAGRVVGVSIGAVQVTAQLGPLSDSSRLVVTAPRLTSLQVVPHTVELPAGTQRQLTALARYAGGLVQDVTDLASWTSADPGVASVVPLGSEGGRVDALTQGTTSVIASFEGTRGEATVRVREAELTGLSVTPPTATAGVWQPVAFSAWGSYSDGSVVDVTPSASWQSEAATVAQVDAAGVARGVRAGQAPITATFEGLSATATLQVIAPRFDRLEVRPKQVSLPVGRSRQLEARGFFTNGGVELSMDVTSLCAWSVEDRDVASVRSLGAAGGIVTALAQGDTTVTARLGNQRDSAELSVGAAVLDFVQVTPLAAAAPPFVLVQYRATAVYSDGSYSDVTEQASWSGADDEVAVVEPGGVVRGLIAGRDRVTASLDGVSGHAALRVLDWTLVDYAVEPAAATVPVDTHGQLRARALYEDGAGARHSIDVTRDSSWSSDSPAVVSVVGAGRWAGRAHAVATGETSVTARLDRGDGQGEVASATVTVVGPALRAILVDPPLAVVPAGRTQAYRATGVYADGSAADVTEQVVWRTGDEEVAGPEGNEPVIRGYAPGRTAVSASLDGIEGRAVMRVTDAVATEARIVPARATTPVGLSSAFRLEASLSDGSVRDVTEEALWTSDDPAVAQVVAAGPGAGGALGVSQGSAAIRAQLDGLTIAPATLDVTTATVRSLIVVPQQASSLVGVPVQYYAVGVFSDGSQRDVSTEVAWWVDDRQVAWVSGRGRAVGLEVGDVRVVASLGGVDATATLHVVGTLVSALRVDPVQAEINAGATQAYRATAILRSGRKLDVTDACTWLSSDPGVATIAASSALGFNLATGVAAGTAQITARLAVPGRVHEAFAELQVEEVVLSELVVSLEDPVIAAGSGTQAHAQAIYSDGSALDVTDLAAWASDDVSVASVSTAVDPGRVTGVAGGQASIAATFEGASDATTLTVVAPSLVRLAVLPTAATVAEGDTATFVALAEYSNGQVDDVTAASVWETSDPDVAEVAGGLGIGVAPGTATFEATFDGLTAQATLTVLDTTPTALIVTPPSASSAPGGTQQFVAHLVDGATSTDVTDESVWSTSSEQVATIVNGAAQSGLATAQAPGTATITAEYTDLGGNVRVGSATFDVEDLPKKPDWVEVLPDDASFVVGDTQQFLLIGHWDLGGTDYARDLTAEPETTFKSTGKSMNVSNALSNKGFGVAVEVGTSAIRGTYVSVSDTTTATVAGP